MTKTVFVTTGATIPFLALLRQFVSSEVHTLLRGLGFQRLVVQYGPQLEQHDLQLYRQFMGAAAADSSNNNGLEVVAFDLKPNLTSDITDADLVISHAGTGSILDALRQNKPLIAVVNTGLMDNHQLQVASSFSANGNLLMCEPTLE